ncbi:hypothetical protein FSZ31_04265 [Sphingorhabdus soli]|uniref:Uncharacterized protein n=1 Tax=Flavisphingopyxis soli TaxID=2601267 RepID=A0A5C6UL65_9SPHN|nr:hypothetical protein [Sphingorhabdus soli]TXC73942.1 hypothetical protein FSZ31_04265 [Sphingorhabdus soli]
MSKAPDLADRIVATLREAKADETADRRTLAKALGVTLKDFDAAVRSLRWAGKVEMDAIRLSPSMRAGGCSPAPRATGAAATAGGGAGSDGPATPSAKRRRPARDLASVGETIIATVKARAKRGLAMPNDVALGKTCGVSFSTVRDAIARMEGRGEMIVERQPRGRKVRIAACGAELRSVRWVDGRAGSPEREAAAYSDPLLAARVKAWRARTGWSQESFVRALALAGNRQGGQSLESLRRFEATGRVFDRGFGRRLEQFIEQYAEPGPFADWQAALARSAVDAKQGEVAAITERVARDQAGRRERVRGQHMDGRRADMIRAPHEPVDRADEAAVAVARASGQSLSFRIQAECMENAADLRRALQQRWDGVWRRACAGAAKAGVSPLQYAVSLIEMGLDCAAEDLAEEAI